ncbi:tetratricopeptide repeat domain protein [Microscilla marina ATCC 23134]|uniref:Tetratricopeptide repeat domain protein n=2 Tax=Microscilla marina TaxID=1027 RepID=A1ZMU8_MICM2|nr:tetratricopeptide repeat domain protein [Microscilla marina ATCC 23134]
MILWLLGGLGSPQAQTNFTETYKKAYAFTTTQPDSALYWAHKSLPLAYTPQQSYDANYLLAYTAYKLCLPGLAIQGYQKAAQIAPNTTKKYKAINNLASTYLAIGDYKKADSLNKQSIAYFAKQKDTYSLSYAYELKGMILKKQDNDSALTVLHKVIRLRQQVDAKNIGIAYHELAAAFVHFGLKDSAVVYQRKALKNYPIKTPDRIALQHTLLAKYLMFNKQIRQALPHLQAAQKLSKRPLTELLWCHTFGLYLSRLNAPNRTRQVFARCDSLLVRALAAAPDAPTRKAISAQAIAMYDDALKLKTLPNSIRLSYQGQLKLAQKNLKFANKTLKLKEDYYSQQLGSVGLPRDNQPTQSNKGWQGVIVGLSVLIGLAGVAFGWRIRQRNKQVPVPTPDPIAKENALVMEVVHVLDTKGIKLKFIDQEAVRLLCRGESYSKIGKELNEKGDTTKTRLNRFAKNAGYASMLELIKTLRNT